MGQWLFDILKNGSIADNQVYMASDGMFTNHRLSRPIQLDRRLKGQWNYPFNDERGIWEFLYDTAVEVGKTFSTPQKEAIVLFNNYDYEHNSENSFFELSGVDCRNFTLTTGNIVGYIKRGDYSLKVSSRFGDNFLKYIISDADGFLEVKDFGGESHGEGYEWLLIYLWKIKMKKAYRLGLPKQYVSKRDRLNTVRGRIDPVDYFITGQNMGIYQCEYREHSYKNDATHLIAETFRKIGKHEFLRDSTIIKNAVYTATDGQRASKKSLYSVKHFTNPFYGDYNDVIDLSKRLLKDELADFGEQSETSAFFFDVSMLFEYFVRKLIKRLGMTIESKFDHRQQIATGVNGYKRKLEPDIVILLGANKFVFDVKYKSFDFRYGVNREDLFQIHTYVGQHGNDANIRACGFIYPISTKTWETHERDLPDLITKETIQIMGKNIDFYVLFVKVPQNDSANYHKEFKINCDQFLSNLTNIIN